MSAQRNHRKWCRRSSMPHQRNHIVRSHRNESIRIARTADFCSDEKLIDVQPQSRLDAIRRALIDIVRTIDQ